MPRRLKIKTQLFSRRTDFYRFEKIILFDYGAPQTAARGSFESARFKNRIATSVKLISTSGLHQKFSGVRLAVAVQVFLGWAQAICFPHTVAHVNKAYERCFFQVAHFLRCPICAN